MTLSADLMTIVNGSPQERLEAARRIERARARPAPSPRPRRHPDSILIRAALAAWSACPYAVVGGPVVEAW